LIPSTLARAAAAVLLVTVSGVSLRRFISSRLGSRSNRVYPPLREPFLVACDGMKLGLEIVGYLRDASGPRKLVINSNIIHDSHGRSTSNPHTNDTHTHPDSLDTSLKIAAHDTQKSPSTKPHEVMAIAYPVCPG